MIRLVYKYLMVVFFIFSLGKGMAQNNPGFLGKKFAMGYSSQYCLLRSDHLFYRESDAPLLQILTNHDMYIEYATSQYKSISAHIAYQKIAVAISHSGGGEGDIGQNFELDGEQYFVRFNKVRGVSDFTMLGMGLRYTSYRSNKTISSPVGFGHYLRLDVYSNKALNNNYVYETAYGSNLTDRQREHVNANFDRSISDPRALNISLGYGIESKHPITQSVYLRLNGEFNFSLNLLKQLNEEANYSSSDYLTVSEDMNKMSKSLNSIRNILLVGMGVGVLL